MTLPTPVPATLFHMDHKKERLTGTADGRRRLLLVGQLRLLDDKREEIRTLRERGGGRSPSRIEALANDLVGIRLVLSAELLAGGLDEAERDGLQRREREARKLLQQVMNA